MYYLGMKSTAYTVFAPYAAHLDAITVYAYDNETAIRKACVKFPAGTYLVAKKG